MKRSLTFGYRVGQVVLHDSGHYAVIIGWDSRLKVCTFSPPLYDMSQCSLRRLKSGSSNTECLLKSDLLT